MKHLKVTIFVAITLVISAAAFSGSTSQSRLSNGCNTHNYAGAYSFVEFGTLHPDNPFGFPPGPYNTAGVVRLEASGHYTVTSTTSVSGTVFNNEFSGTYTIGDDCGIRLMFGGIQLSVNYLSADRKSLYGIATIPKTNITILGSGR